MYYGHYIRTISGWKYSWEKICGKKFRLSRLQTIKKYFISLWQENFYVFNFHRTWHLTKFFLH